MYRIALVLIIIAIGLAAYLISVYNSLVALRNRIKNAFAQIDVQLKRRYDLIPNLVETAKAYLAHERQTLEAVIAARNQAAAANEKAAQNPDPAAVRALAGAEGALTGALTRFFALAENYPDLKASANMRQLTEELTSTENRVAFARQAYNDAVLAYNNRREQFPANMVASHMGFEAAQSFEIEDAAQREAPKVSFS